MTERSMVNIEYLSAPLPFRPEKRRCTELAGFRGENKCYFGSPKFIEGNAKGV